MVESNRDALLRSIDDFEATLAELQSNNVVAATPVLLQRLEELESSASALGDPTLIAMIEKLRRQLTIGIDVLRKYSDRHHSVAAHRPITRSPVPRQASIRDASH